LNTSIQVAIALLPFAVLFSAFLAFKMDALHACFCAWVLEFAVVLTYYHMPLLRSLESFVWGDLVMWSGFVVLYAGQVFGQSYRSTGLLEMLLESVQSILPSWDIQGRSFALVTVVGGFIGAFNGFATYPVTIPGLVDLGFDGVLACTSYLVYFSWTLAFNSLFIAPTITNAASHVPIVDIVRVAGLLTIPLVYLSLLGFLKILGFRFFERRCQLLFWSLGTGNALALLLFTVVWPAYYIVTMIAGAAMSLGALYVYGRSAKRQDVAGALAAADPPMEKPRTTGSTLLNAYAPLVLGIIIVLLTRVHAVAELLAHSQFSVAAWGYSRVSVNILTTSGFFILITAFVCYFFRSKQANALKDLVIATKRSRTSLGTLLLGSGTVYLMVDTGQIALLGRILSSGGKMIYASFYPVVAFLGGMAFGQGLPGDFLLSQMQVRVASALGIPLMVLVGIVTAVTMGPPNAVKPTQIAFTASLANVEGRDGEIFRICLPWVLLQLVVTAVFAVVVVLLWR